MPPLRCHAAAFIVLPFHAIILRHDAAFFADISIFFMPARLFRRQRFAIFFHTR
jgi:hypothetical protein